MYFFDRTFFKIYILFCLQSVRRPLRRRAHTDALPPKLLALQDLPQYLLDEVDLLQGPRPPQGPGYGGFAAGASGTSRHPPPYADPGESSLGEMLIFFFY